MKIAAALKRAAQDAGLTDVQLAAIASVSQQTANRWLSGKTEPRGEQLLILVKEVPGFGKLVGLSVAA